MASGLSRNWCHRNWLRLNLLSPWISAGFLLALPSQQIAAQTLNGQSLVPIPAPQKTLQKVPDQLVPSLDRAPLGNPPSTEGSPTSSTSPQFLQPGIQESPPFEAQDGKPAIAIVIPPDPSLYQPTLPPLGDSTYYLPVDTNVLGMRLVVRLSQRRVYLYKQDQVVASYPIAIGKPGWETPVGEYRVFNMEKNPIFKSFKSGRIIKPGPDNPLGVRWIGIWTDGKTQLGFHGTNEPELIGHAVSHGCIRMLNKDVTALFDQVAIGTPVRVER